MVTPSFANNDALDQTLSLFSPAKINLFLHITGRRADGYHNLQTVFRLLNWGDTLDFTASTKIFETKTIIAQSQGSTLSELPIKLYCEHSLTEDVLDNLIVKAALHLLVWVDANRNKRIKPLPTRLPTIDVDLHKVLPTGAGLGGGSSNAATTLIALNTLWNLELETTDLIAIGKGIGADVPIFLFGQDAIAEGIGEKLTSIDLPFQHYLILNPNAHASTQALFAHSDLNRAVERLTHEQIITQQNDYTNYLQPPYRNVFEPIVINLVTEVAEALNYLRQLESIAKGTARMTGSGSSIYLPIQADRIADIKHYVNFEKPPPCHALITTSYSTKMTSMLK